MIKIFTLLLLLFFAGFNFAENVVRIPAIGRPDTLTVTQKHLYVTEGATVYVYLLKNLELIKKFGKEGEGPQEFSLNPYYYRGGVLLNVENSNIYICCINKISVFSSDLSFKKEVRVKSGLEFIPYKEKFLGYELINEGKVTYRVLNIYDSNLNKLKEVFRNEHSVQQGKGAMPLGSNFFFRTNGNKIFVCGSTEFIIDVYDNNGKKLYSIKHNYEKLKVQEDFKKNVYNFYKTSRLYKQNYEWIKQQLRFPDYFPAIRDFIIDEDMLYVRTWNYSEKEVEVIICSINGNFLKKLFLPIISNDSLNPYPYTIKNRKIYQMIENEEKEEWKLHIHDIYDTK